MLVLFRLGEAAGFDAGDIIDVLPREREAQIRREGLGRKEGHFFWVEVDTTQLSDAQFNELAERLTSPELVEVPRAAHPVKTTHKKYRVVKKRKYQMNLEKLQALDAHFDARKAATTQEARRIYPRRKLTLEQFRKIIREKPSGD
jgi:hypothetical protein